MNIPDAWLKIKNLVGDVLSEWGLLLAVILVALGAFGLGRLSAFEGARPPVVVREAPEETEARGMHIGGLIVASRRGSAYHYPWCPGAQSISSQNRVWFSSEEGAREAGYAPAKNCRGLGEK